MAESVNLVSFVNTKILFTNILPPFHGGCLIIKVVILLLQLNFVQLKYPHVNINTKLLHRRPMAVTQW
jgi:hypothetical protein